MILLQYDVHSSAGLFLSSNPISQESLERAVLF